MRYPLYFLLLLGSVACQYAPDTELDALTEVAPSGSPLHRAIELPHDLSRSHADQFIEVTVGEIALPTGQVIVSDPFYSRDQQPFARRVTPGTYPVKLYLHRIEPGYYRVAYAKIKFQPEKASRWLLAITEEAPLDKLLTKQGKAHEGFHADAGLGCFMDAATHRRYLKQVDDWYWEQPKGANYFQQVLAGEFETYSGSHPYSHAYGDWNNHVVDVTQGLNVMMFSTGWGHGYYPAYWGYADGEEAVELTIDFQI